MLLVTDRAGDLWVKTWNRSSLHTRPSWTVDTFQRQLKYHLFTHFIHTILVLPPSDYMYYYHYYLFGTKTAKACKNVYWLLLQSTAANISASQLLLRQNSKQKVVDRQPTIVWLRWSKHWLCQMQTKQTQAVGQVVDQVVRQVEVSETVQLSYSVWQSLNFVLWDVQLRQFLQSSNLLQLTTHKTCKTKPTSQTNKLNQIDRTIHYLCWQNLHNKQCFLQSRLTQRSSQKNESTEQITCEIIFEYCLWDLYDSRFQSTE